MTGIRGILGLALCAGIVAAGGCRDSSEKRAKTVTARGVATKIDLTTNQVAMKTRVEKTGKEMEVFGTTTPETEVWINGVKKSLSDVEVGDEITVEGVRTGEGLEQKYVVSRVDIVRPQGWKSTAGKDMGAASASDTDAPPPPPTTQPAVSPAAPPADPADIARKREEAMNTLYGEIRRRMDEAIALRAGLLQEGRPATDPEVLRHEKVIRNARNLLMERGENVEPVVPPLSDEPAAAAPAPAPTQPAVD